MVMQRTNVITASGDQVNVTGTLFVSPVSFTFLIANSGLGVIMSGQGVLISGQQVEISGQPVIISGQPITVDAARSSGINVVVQSGLGVVGSLTVNVSGQPVTVSGQPVAIVSGSIVTGQSGLNVVAQSGLGVITPSVIAVRARAILLVTADSGGQTLVSGVITTAFVRSLDGEIYLGGNTGIDMPYSGYGILVQQGDRLSIPVNNFNLINVCAAISGNRISYGGVD